MGFAPGGVWVMGYRGCMAYEVHFPANQLGGPKKVWGMREYGLSGLWVMRESTVIPTSVSGFNSEEAVIAEVENKA